MPLNDGRESPTHFFLQHGWGFDQRSFREWPEILGPGAVTLLDRGYLGGAPVQLSNDHSGEQRILVSHSLGLHFVTIDQLASFAMIVVLSGFASFHGLNPGGSSISRKHIARMKRRLRREPEKLLADFYRDCSWPGQLPDFARMNVDLLADDLHLLDTAVLRELGASQACRVLILHGALDRIVSVERAAELQALVAGSTLQVIDDAGHGLPFTHARQCLAHITEHVKRL